MTKRRILLGVALALVIWLGWPIKTMSGPDWAVTVRDSQGRPQPKVLVRESYQNYSAEFQGHETDRYTDQNGEAHFSAVHLRVMRAKRIVVTAMSALALAHASFGPHAYLTAFSGSASGYVVVNGVVYDWTGYPAHLQSEISMRNE